VIGVQRVTRARGGDALTVVPERGGIVTSLLVGGDELLYLDESTLLDASKNVRGGIPVLFPICGPLRGDAWEGRVMKQHGFARNLAWDVIEEKDGGVVLGLESCDATRSQYPFKFSLRFTFQLVDRGLRIEQRIRNAGEGAMPFCLGLHPYFATRDNAGARVDVEATQVADNPYGEPRPRPDALPLADGVDLCFLDAAKPEGTLVDGERRIHLRAGSPYRYVVVWTQPGKPFCCLEPWSARGDALNTGADLQILAAGQTVQTWVEITQEA